MELTDLAAKRLGGVVLAANDEFFAPKENLLEPAAPVWDEHRYTDQGKWMDGWETRRRRTPGHDWALVRLGLAGVIRGVLVDTSFFRGNYPEACSLEAAVVDGDEDATGPSVAWVEVLPRSMLSGDSHNRFPVDSPFRFTHLRLNIFPDGGVARLRVHGEVVPDPAAVGGHDREVDLAAVEHGGQVVASSDMFFSSRANLVMPGPGLDMRDGWETRRRRGPGHDWAIVKLAASGVVRRVEVDTSHFKGNFPERCSLEVCDALDASPEELGSERVGWRELLAPVRLEPHKRHVFEVPDAGAATHARFAVYPDGGVSRLRLWGSVDGAGWAALGVRRLDSLLPAVAEAELLRCCGSTAWAREMSARRPFVDLDELEASADEVWAMLDRGDRLEAFAAHPRIGEREPPAQASATRAWAGQEQAGAAGADAGTLDALRAANAAYEERFGWRFIVFASGKSAPEMFALLDERMPNPPDKELEVAAEQQRRITLLRLRKLVAP